MQSACWDGVRVVLETDTARDAGVQSCSGVVDGDCIAW
jgi:hypothetical protein